MTFIKHLLCTRHCSRCWSFNDESNLTPSYFKSATSLVAQMVKHLPTLRKTQVQTLGGEDLLEKEMVPNSSTLAWKIPRTEEPGRLQSTGLQRVRHN